jgi:predicted DNA-binding ribbon-helix-helix protein
MKLTKIPTEGGSHTLGIEFLYDEIDQLLSFASAVRTFRPEWLDHQVFVQGRDPRTNEPLSYDNCTLISAYSWGYLRTLIAHNKDNMQITIGGGNAIMEDIAIEVVKFRTISYDKDDWLTARRRVTDLIQDVLKSDYEEHIWQHEFAIGEKNDVAILKVISNLKDRLKSRNNFTAQHAACTIFPRLKSIPRLCSDDIPSIESFLEEPLNMVLEGKDAFLQMHVCEALFWISFDKLRRELQQKIAAVFAKCLKSEDTNVKLAALITAAKHGLLPTLNLGATLYELASDVASKNHPYLRHVKITCETLMKREDLYRLSEESKRTISALLSKIYEESPDLEESRRWMDKVRTASTNKEKKESLEMLAKTIFSSHPDVEHIKRDLRTHTGEIDLYFKVKKGPLLGYFEDASNSIFAVECKHEKKAMSADAIRVFLSKLLEQQLNHGVIVAAKGITGKPGWDGYGVLQNFFMMHGVKVVIFTLEDFENIIEGESLTGIWERKLIDAQWGKLD